MAGKPPGRSVLTGAQEPTLRRQTRCSRTTKVSSSRAGLTSSAENRFFTRVDLSADSPREKASRATPREAHKGRSPGPPGFPSGRRGPRPGRLHSPQTLTPRHPLLGAATGRTRLPVPGGLLPRRPRGQRQPGSFPIARELDEGRAPGDRQPARPEVLGHGRCNCIPGVHNCSPEDRSALRGGDAAVPQQAAFRTGCPAATRADGSSGRRSNGIANSP
jgi:hypothetical protein